MIGSAQAEDFTAGFVMENMERPERYAYVSGIVEGLAYARYIDDGKQAGLGMRCIYEWFYEDDTHTQETIYAAFERYPSHTPGALVAALAEQECGTP